MIYIVLRWRMVPLLINKTAGAENFLGRNMGPDEENKKKNYSRQENVPHLLFYYFVCRQYVSHQMVFHSEKEIFTMCLPVSITRSCTSLNVKLTTLLKRKARPVAPVNRVLISSERFVKLVSHRAHENRRLPPMCSRNTFPILWLQIY